MEKYGIYFYPDLYKWGKYTTKTGVFLTFFSIFPFQIINLVRGYKNFRVTFKLNATKQFDFKILLNILVLTSSELTSS